MLLSAARVVPDSTPGWTKGLGFVQYSKMVCVAVGIERMDGKVTTMCTIKLLTNQKWPFCYITFLLETSLKYLVQKKYVMLCRNGAFIINGSIWVVAFYNGSISARGLNNNLDAHTPLCA